MDQFWKDALKVGGIGAVGLYVLWSIYSQMLSLPVFSKLGQSLTFLLLMAVLACIIHRVIDGSENRRGQERERAWRLRRGDPGLVVARTGSGGARCPAAHGGLAALAASSVKLRR
jgi:hypothetical protein